MLFKHPLGVLDMFIYYSTVYSTKYEFHQANASKLLTSIYTSFAYILCNFIDFIFRFDELRSQTCLAIIIS